MKISISTVKRVWMYWLENREAVPIKKSGGRRKKLIVKTVQIIEIHKEQKLGARGWKRSWNSNIISKSHTMRSMKFCLKRDWRVRTRKKNRRKPELGTRESISWLAVHLDIGIPPRSIERKYASSLMTVQRRILAGGGSMQLQHRPA